MPSLLLLLLLVTQSLAASQTILSNPEQLRVTTEPSRSALIVSRAVMPETEAPRTTPNPAADNSTASTTTPSQRTTPQSPKTTGHIEIAFAGIRELDANASEVKKTLQQICRPTYSVVVSVEM